MHIFDEVITWVVVMLCDVMQNHVGHHITSSRCESDGSVARGAIITTEFARVEAH
jgi:hypothetical protein